MDFGLCPKPGNPAQHQDLIPEAESLDFNKEVNKEMNGFRPMSKT